MSDTHPFYKLTELIDIFNKSRNTLDLNTQGTFVFSKFRFAIHYLSLSHSLRLLSCTFPAIFSLRIMMQVL